MNDFITIHGANENNLKNVSLKIPKNKLIAITGLSGSGKSTLAFDTLQRECQRLYMESLGMATDLLPRAKVDKIKGLSPSISVTQHQGNMNPRSTVGTLTDISTFFRILFSKSSVNGLEPSHFSSNTPDGACPVCNGLGSTTEVDLSKLINYEKSIEEGALYGWDHAYIHRYGQSMTNAGKHYGFEFSPHMAIGDYNETQMTLLLHGVESEAFKKLYPLTKPPKTVPSGNYEGYVTNLKRRYAEKKSSSDKLNQFFVSSTCPECFGDKLKKESLEVKIDDKNILEVYAMEIAETHKWLSAYLVQMIPSKKESIEPITTILLEKLSRLMEIGLGYLSLDRLASSLSAGELQRIRLSTLLGTGLTGVLYVLDEPTTGLHASDNLKLITFLKSLRDMGNTVLVVEHDPEFIVACDYVIDIGPGAGKHGGEIVATAPPQALSNMPQSVTGKYLYKTYENRKPVDHVKALKNIHITNAQTNNLKNISVDIPLEKLVTIAGVSGAGKSSLLMEVVKQYKEAIKIIDQKPIGRSSRSNAATYTDIFTPIRTLFSEMPESGLKAKDFSFNSPGGRCDHCEGKGVLLVAMHFMPDIEVICPECRGEKYKPHVLEVLYKGYSISDVLKMSVEEAYELFKHEKVISSKLETLKKVGLGYLSLGQSASTLSGGEAQRVKLAKELSASETKGTLYLFDEPTTGLHPLDVERLIAVLKKLVDQGNSVVVIEHNTDFIHASDWVITMGPGGGRNGGQIISNGNIL